MNFKQECELKAKEELYKLTGQPIDGTFFYTIFDNGAEFAIKLILLRLKQLEKKDLESFAYRASTKFSEILEKEFLG
jgi:hypothetical protein